jgi:hypothetical protein
MKRYNFEILQGGTTSAVERNVPIADEDTLWLRIGAIAKRIPKSNCFIKVTDEVGDIVALVGVATATYLCAARLLADYVNGLLDWISAGASETRGLQDPHS